MELTVNSVIKYVSVSEHPVLEVILWIDNKTDSIITYEMMDKDALPLIKKRNEIEMLLASNDISIIPNPYYKFVDEMTISEKYRKIRDDRWDKIKDIVCNEPDIYIKTKRSKLIKNLMSTKGLKHHKSIYKYLRMYWINGKTPNALLPDYNNSGGKGKNKSSGELKRGRKSENIEGINVTPDIKQVIVKSFDTFYNKTDLTLRQAYQKMLENYFTEGYYTNEQDNLVPLIKSRHPSLNQFVYWGKDAFTTKDILLKKKGERVYALNHRSILGESTSEAYSPGRLFQVDATIADIYLVSRLNSNWIIGRPVVYMVIDVFSRMIVGFYVGLEGPSWIGAMMAIYNTTRNKVDLCKEYDIPIRPEDWPCNHLPENLIADRGEFESNKTSSLKANLGVNIKILPPYRADWKGIVEQNFRKFNNKTIHWLKGSIKKEYRVRGEEDYRLGALLNIQEFTKIIIYSILYFNKRYMNYYERDVQMIKDDIPPIPNELWKWGIKNRSGALKTYSEDIIKLNLMPSITCNITEKGLVFQKRRYSNQQMVESGIYEHIRAYGSIEKVISYDPRNTDSVYINEGNHFIKLIATDAIFNNYYYEELDCLQAVETSEEVKSQQNDYQDTASLNANINSIIEPATKREREYLESKNKRIKNIRENRKNEKETYRQAENWDLDSETNIKQKSKNSNNEAYTPRPNYLDIINMDIEREDESNE